MNTLKKKIIYNFILTTVVLVIVEGYIFYGCFAKATYFATQTGISEALIGMGGLIVGSVLFALIAYFYYAQISKSIKDETNRQMKERNLLFANIAHDLKNPMSSILGFSRALEDDSVKEEERQYIVHTICNKSLQVDDMIKKMFQYAKMDTAGYELRKATVDLCSLIREVVAATYEQIEEKKMKLDIQLPEEKVFVCVDVTEFTRLIQNLVGNAIRHNEEGTQIGIFLEENPNLKIVIADTGNVIEKTMQEAIFEPFQCSDESRTKKDGSGLGLAIAKKIAQMHGADLTIREDIKGYTKAFVVCFTK